MERATDKLQDKSSLLSHNVRQQLFLNTTSSVKSESLTCFNVRHAIFIFIAGATPFLKLSLEITHSTSLQNMFVGRS